VLLRDRATLPTTGFGPGRSVAPPACPAGLLCRLAPTVGEGRPCVVPWCETCSRFYNSNNVAPDGTCVTCGRFIADPAEVEEQQAGKVPWHFWILVVALVLYIGWRLVQLVQWLL